MAARWAGGCRRIGALRLSPYRMPTLMRLKRSTVTLTSATILYPTPTPTDTLSSGQARHPRTPMGHVHLHNANGTAEVWMAD
jgi:hypothetical protein